MQCISLGSKRKKKKKEAIRRKRVWNNERRGSAWLRACNQLRIHNLAQFIQFYNQREEKENNAIGTAAKRFKTFSLVSEKIKYSLVKALPLFFFFFPQV